MSRAPFPSVAEGLIEESRVYSLLQAGPEFRAWRAATPVRKRAVSGEAPVVLTREATTLRVELNRPEVRNALNVAMRDALLDAFAVAAADPDLRVVVSGRGAAFCTGGDLDEFGTFPDPATAHEIRLQTSIGAAIERLADRVTFRVHGACFGSGIELPAFAGRVIAAADASFALPELGLGLIPGAGGTVSLTRRIGVERTMALALSREPIDAPTALAWGLIDEIAVV